MDTNILIRTFTAGRGWLQFPVGGGIVADSDPEREYEETLHKAEGLLQAGPKVIGGQTVPTTDHYFFTIASWHQPRFSVPFLLPSPLK